MAVTAQQIAELAGVSRGTVDRALHNRGRVNPEVAARIQRIAEELGYNLDQCGYPHEEEEILDPMGHGKAASFIKWYGEGTVSCPHQKDFAVLFIVAQYKLDHASAVSFALMIGMGGDVFDFVHPVILPSHHADANYFPLVG